MLIDMDICTMNNALHSLGSPLSPCEISAGPCKTSIVHCAEFVIPYIRTVRQDKDRGRDDSKKPSGQVTLTEFLEVHSEQGGGK